MGRWITACAMMAIAAMTLAASGADKPAGEKPALEPHPINKTFWITGIKSDDEAKKIAEAIRKLPSVTNVADLTATSGYVHVAFDTHKIASHLIAQTIMDQGDYKVMLRFQVPQYKDHKEKVDALFARLKEKQFVEIKSEDGKDPGMFTLTYLPIKPDLSDPRKIGFNPGHLGHPLHDPPPKGLGITLKMTEIPAAKK